jgi:hypothetical protein
MFRNQSLRVSSYIYLFILFITCLTACRRKTNVPGTPAFSQTPEAHEIHPLSILEASGMADSKTNPGCLWIVEDSGNPPYLHLLKHDGTVLKTMFLTAYNWDWEDLVLSTGPEPGKNYLYIADVGDNSRQRWEYIIFRLEEPTATEDTITKIDPIPFKYPDGYHDAEAMLIDPATKDIFIITKTDHRSLIYKMTYPYGTTRWNKVEKVGELPDNFVTSAALSPDGKDIVVRTYADIYYYPHSAGESLAQSLRKTPVNLPYQIEPQGESITFAANNSGYYTTSEKALALMVKLYYYKRK